MRPMLFLSLLIHGLVLNIPLPPQPELQTEEIIENVETAEIPPLPKPPPSPSPSKKPDKPKPTPSSSAVSRSRPKPPPLQSSPQINISDNTLTKKPFPEDDDDEVIKNDDRREQEVEDDDDGQDGSSDDEDDDDGQDEPSDDEDDDDEEVDPVQFFNDFPHDPGAKPCDSGKPQCKQISRKSRREVVRNLKNNQGYELEEQTDLRQVHNPNAPFPRTIFQVFKVVKEDGKELYLNVYAPSEDTNDPMEYRFSEKPLTIAEFQEP